MSCCRPFSIPNPNAKIFKLAKSYIDVPCGWCLNCRLDKINFIDDCSTFQLRARKSFAAFVTVTYSDFELKRLGLWSGRDKKVYPKATLCYKHIQDFLKRLRIYCTRHNLWNDTSIQKNFSYICATEYGGSFNRPHAHFIFYGLDYKVMDKIFFKCWSHGICDSLPVEKGCCRYVLKYIEKEVKGPKAVELYDNNGLERPRHRISSGFYLPLLNANWDYINSHDGNYKLSYHNERPISMYLRNKLRLGKISAVKKYYNTAKKLRDNHVSSCYKVYGSYFETEFLNSGYSIKFLNEYKKQLAINREKKLIE